MLHSLTASPRVGIFADNLISIGLCIRFPKMFVCENPPGGAWGVRLARGLNQKTKPSEVVFFEHFYLKQKMKGSR